MHSLKTGVQAKGMNTNDINDMDYNYLTSLDHHVSQKRAEVKPFTLT
jgi:hypothetical protein